MKPQCETAAECLKELARVMEQFDINDSLTALNSNFVKYAGECGGWSNNCIPPFHLPGKWQFAIAEVEGKPVFIGDVLYNEGEKFTVELAREREDIWAKPEVPFLYRTSETGHVYFMQLTSANSLSWNPPRPKTVMVEITIEDAEYVTGKRLYYISEMLAYARRNEEACKKALESIK